jgi:hypothetical protein
MLSGVAAETPKFRHVESIAPDLTWATDERRGDLRPLGPEHGHHFQN